MPGRELRGEVRAVCVSCSFIVPATFVFFRISSGITFCGTWCPLNACVMILTPSSHATCVRDGFNVGIKRVLSVSDSTIWYSILPCSAERLDRGFSEIADWRDW